MARQPLDSLLEEASPSLSQAAAWAARCNTLTWKCNTLTWKWDQEKSGSLLLLEVFCRKILPGMFISWESESQQIMANSKKWPNSLAKVVTVGLWQCTHNLQLHLGMLVLPISSHLAPHTSSCQVVCQLILIQTSVLARFREKREMIPSGSAKKSHGAECHQPTDGTAAKSQLPCEQELWQSGSGGTRLRVYWQGKNWANDQFLPDHVSRGIVTLISFIWSCWQMKQSYILT